MQKNSLHVTILKNGENIAAVLPEGSIIPIIGGQASKETLLAVLSRMFPKINFELLDVSSRGGSSCRCSGEETIHHLQLNDALC